MMKKVFAILILSFAAFISTKAQTGIGFSYYSQNADSLYFNDTLKVKIFMKFFGPQGQVFTSQVKFRYKINNILQQDSLSDAVLPYFQIPANTGAQVNLDLPVSVSKFMTGGGHTIIVWPVYADTSFHQLDSAKFSVYVRGYLGVEESDNKLFSVTPNPFHEFFAVQFPEEINLKDVVLISVTGARVPVKTIIQKGRVYAETETLSPGIYLLLMKSQDGKLYTHRLLKQ